MNHMLEALKKKAMETKSGKSMHDQEDPAGPAPFRDHEIESKQPDIPDEEASEMKDAQDVEGHLDAAKGGMEHLKGLHGGEEESPDHMAMLESLLDHKGGGGKLSAMVADRAKEKMASMMKHKKGY